MGFSKAFRSKMDKVFSPTSRDPEVVNDPPPPYVLPPEFIEAGIKEDDLEILKDYDTVIIVDDSGSMEPLWNQVIDTSSPLLVDSVPKFLVFCCRRVMHCRHSPSSPPDMTRMVLKSGSLITARGGTTKSR